MTIYEISVLIALFFFAWAMLTLSDIVPKPNWSHIKQRIDDARNEEEDDEDETPKHKRKAKTHKEFIKKVPEEE